MDGEGAPTPTRLPASNENPAGPADSAAPRHRNAIPLLITIAAGILVYGLFYNRGIWLAVVGYSVSPAQRVLGGEVPYRDFLFNYTPGILWLNAAVMKAFGSALLPIHACLLVFKTAALITLYLLGKRLMPAWLALVPVALTLCWLGHRFIFNVHPTQYAILFVLAAMIAILKFDETEDTRWLIASGLLIGVVFVFKYNVGLILLGTGSAAIIVPDVVRWFGRSTVPATRTLIRVAGYWLGFGLVTSVMCVYLALNGALGPMLDHFMHHAADYSEERAIGLPSWRMLFPAATGLLTAVIGLQLVRMQAPRLLRAAVLLLAAIGGALVLIPGRAAILKDAATATAAYFPALTFLAAACWIVFRLLDRKRGQDSASGVDRKSGVDRSEGANHAEPANHADPVARERRLMIVGCLALGSYLEVFPRADYYHLVRVLPPVFVCLVFLIFCIFAWARRFQWTSRSRDAGALTTGSLEQLMAGLATLLVLMLAFTGIKDTWLPQFDGWVRLADRVPVATARTRGILTGEYEAGMIQELTALIQANSEPGESIFSFARRGAGFYFFADRRNPTRLLWWDSVGIKPSERAAVLDMIEGGAPKLVLIQMALDDRQVRETIHLKYHRVGIVEDIEVFGRSEGIAN
jgi:4-amino-4-deoxy-L-arabinose transferase-like glycosyltransferase